MLITGGGARSTEPADSEHQRTALKGLNKVEYEKKTALLDLYAKLAEGEKQFADGQSMTTSGSQIKTETKICLKILKGSIYGKR